MESVTVSPKFQVVIPLSVRRALGLQPGEKMQVVHYQDRVELIPVRPAKKLRGSLRGIDTNVPRDADRT
jgi:AbrB family looped-hinge helix DNA binding protein